MTSTALDTLQRLHADQPVRRGWPARDGAVTFEAFGDDGRSIRAGIIDAEGRVRWAPFGQDRKLPSLRVGGGELLVHRYGKRAVVRNGSAVVKHVRPGKAASIARVSVLVRGACRPLGLGAAQVVDQMDSSVTFSILPGHTLHAMPAAAGWDAFVELWPKWMRSGSGLALPEYGPADEARTLLEWAGKVRVFGVPRAEELHRAAEQVAGLLMEANAEAALRGGMARALLHRDLHDKQLLWDGGTLSVLDLDTAAFGDPGLDIGNLIAHLYLRELQGKLDPAMAVRLRERLACMPGVGPGLGVWVMAARVRLCCVYAFRPGSAHWWERWVTGTLAGVNELMKQK